MWDVLNITRFCIRGVISRSGEGATLGGVRVPVAFWMKRPEHRAVSVQSIAEAAGVTRQAVYAILERLKSHPLP